ncbi:MAG TPA: acyl-CoA dehydrogenase family protein [Burkholderiaceae bacterium]|nr:acyl-CoA dehydrogenase family protein [Burkholderiaceae bacterium]
MSVTSPIAPATDSVPAGFAPDALDAACAAATTAADRLVDALRERLRGRVGRPADPAALEREQAAAHGVAWAATYARALREMHGWARRLRAIGRLGELESALLAAAFGEYLAQLAGGLPMSQGEIFRPDALDADGSALAAFAADPAVRALRERGFAPAARARIAALLVDGRAARAFGDAGHEDPTLDEIRTQFARWSDDHAAAAHGWHLRNDLIPDAVIAELGALGVFGLTVPEGWGGSGLGKAAMCVVTEELSRGWIGLGSLGTRTEIACELILGAGTDAQRARWLPGLVSGAVIPTASFTEPDTGSDLASLRTRAEPGTDEAGRACWRLHGAKTWTTHGARSDLMTLLARTERDAPGYRGLSMFLVPKPRGTDADPFPAPGMSGGEIEVLGYRGMKEYEIGFDGYAIPGDALLGGARGHGFKQLMRTFESARIQTAARAVGVAQSALELGLDYACGRVQFGRPIVAFPRVADKLAWMAVEIMIARQLTRFAAREKDAGRRCDLEAGMAKLLAARVAWSCADNAVQVHGGNGYALEYPASRVLVDARILNVFEGAAEIQTQIVARALLD